MKTSCTTFQGGGASAVAPCASAWPPALGGRGRARAGPSVDSRKADGGSPDPCHGTARVVAFEVSSGEVPMDSEAARLQRKPFWPRGTGGTTTRSPTTPAPMSCSGTTYAAARWRDRPATLTASSRPRKLSRRCREKPSPAKWRGTGRPRNVWRGRHTAPLKLSSGGTIEPTNQQVTVHLASHMEVDGDGTPTAIRMYGTTDDIPIIAHAAGSG